MLWRPTVVQVFYVTVQLHQLHGVVEQQPRGLVVLEGLLLLCGLHFGYSRANGLNVGAQIRHC